MGWQRHREAALAAVAIQQHGRPGPGLLRFARKDAGLCWRHCVHMGSRGDPALGKENADACETTVS